MRRMRSKFSVGKEWAWAEEGGMRWERIEWKEDGPGANRVTMNEMGENSLHVAVTSQFLRNTMALLRVYNAIWILLGTEIALEREEEDGELVLEGGLEGLVPLFGEGGDGLIFGSPLILGGGLVCWWMCVGLGKGQSVVTLDDVFAWVKTYECLQVE